MKITFWYIKNFISFHFLMVEFIKRKKERKHSNKKRIERNREIVFFKKDLFNYLYYMFSL